MRRTDPPAGIAPAAIDASERVLCRLTDIPEDGARGFGAAPGGFTGLFAVRKAGRVFVYVNACPHIGLPLEPMPDRFLDHRRQAILCAVHGARFRIEDGKCLSGPCIGEALEPVAVRIVNGQVVVPADAGL